MLTMGDDIQTVIPPLPEYRQVLTPEGLAFLEKLHPAFNPIRLELLQAQEKRQNELGRVALLRGLLGQEDDIQVSNRTEAATWSLPRGANKWKFATSQRGMGNSDKTIQI